MRVHEVNKRGDQKRRVRRKLMTQEEKQMRRLVEEFKVNKEANNWVYIGKKYSLS